MLAIHEALNLREGNLIAVYLSDHGVAAEVRGGQHHSLRGEVSNIRGLLPLIFIQDPGQADQARVLISDYEAMLKRAQEGDPWVCPGCGETLEPQFQSCWKCQAEKPA